MTFQTQHLDNFPLLIWVISLDSLLSSIGPFTKLTNLSLPKGEGKSDIAMADETKIEQFIPAEEGKQKAGIQKMQNKPKSKPKLSDLFLPKGEAKSDIALSMADKPNSSLWPSVPLSVRSPKDCGKKYKTKPNLTIP
jgi:hypothetical protein